MSFSILHLVVEKPTSANSHSSGRDQTFSEPTTFPHTTFCLFVSSCIGLNSPCCLKKKDSPSHPTGFSQYAHHCHWEHYCREMNTVLDTFMLFCGVSFFLGFNICFVALKISTSVQIYPAHFHTHCNLLFPLYFPCAVCPRTGNCSRERENPLRHHFLFGDMVAGYSLATWSLGTSWSSLIQSLACWFLGRCQHIPAVVTGTPQCTKRFIGFRITSLKLLHSHL